MPRASTGIRSPGRPSGPARPGLPCASPADVAMDTDRSDWRDGAACLHTDPELFFPVSTTRPPLGQVHEPKRICQASPVQPPCLAWALRQGISTGVWGGTTAEERRATRRAAV